MPHIKDYTGKRAHMIGIGGSSMSGLAGMLVKLGVRVTGSDSARSYTTDALEQSGIHVFIGQRAENVDGADLVIYSAAIAKDNPERMRAEELGIPQGGVVLGKLSGRHALREHAQELGFELTEHELDRAFEKFKELADRKKTILDADIEALINEGHGLKSNQYEIDTFQIMSGNHTTSTATIILVKDGQRFSEAATGNGPVEAAMNAINRITGHEYTLDSYGLRGVTEGSDALGEVTVKIHNGDGLVHTGRGVSTDVIEASIRAYVNAINKTL